MLGKGAVEATEGIKAAFEGDISDLGVAQDQQALGLRDPLLKKKCPDRHPPMFAKKSHGIFGI